MDIDTVRKELLLRYGLIISSPENPLILTNNIAGYCSLINKNEILKNLLTPLKLEAKTAYKEYLNIYRKVRKYWNNTCEKINNLAKENNYAEKNNSLDYLTPLYENFPMFDSLPKDETTKLNLIINFLSTKTDKDTLNNLNIFEQKIKKYYWLLQNEMEKFQSQCDFEIWGAYLNLQTITDILLHTSIADEFLENRYDDLNIEYWSAYSNYKKHTPDKAPFLDMLEKDSLIPKIKLLNNYLENGLNNSKNNLNKELTGEKIPDGWSLCPETSSEKAIIKFKDSLIYVFPRTYSDKYHYFKEMWDNSGNITSFEKLSLSRGISSYPKIKGEINKENIRIRDSLSKLRKEFKNKKVPIDIVEQKGWYLHFQSIT